MKGKVLLVSQRCPVCKAVKKKMEQSGELSKVQVVDVETEEGKQLIKTMEIKAVPDCVIVEEDGNVRRVRMCTQDEWRDLLKRE